ncbi:MAG: PspA-associated protein PspAA [Miltoncostaeaceae bacterium]
MIVRILGEGQYRLDDAAFAAVSEIDERVQAAHDANDADGFHTALEALAQAVRDKGARLPDDEFVGSDAMVPGPDTSLAEAREMLGEGGLIPG